MSPFQVDSGFARPFALTECLALEFRTEVSNVFNHPQYGQPQADWSVSSGSGAFGRITTAVNTGPVGTGTPRQAQFILRLAF